MKNKNYYKTDNGLLIVNYTEHNIYVIKSTIEKGDNRISKEEFDKLNTTKIKKEVYNYLMNIYFKDIHEKWIYSGNNHEYISKDNFKTDGYCLSTNYVIGKDIPYHTIKYSDGTIRHSNLIIVYHQGKVYYHTISYGGYKQGQLIDIETEKIVSWCQLKHCAPVFDLTLKKII